ncbi:hypothetical protein ACFWCF_03930 [Rhodococcus sp. NPDC060090]|uniref:hypothetical protein n=1 Tax=Rhodococcus sp. NPDC060090 TaxID=3347056 RepID=UPI003659E9D6
MNRPKDRSSDEDDARTDPPGPADHGRDGGMATRENAPEVVQRSDDDHRPEH